MALCLDWSNDLLGGYISIFFDMSPDFDVEYSLFLFAPIGLIFWKDHGGYFPMCLNTFMNMAPM